MTVYHSSDLLQVSLGLPLGFVLQNQSGYAPPFPWQTRFYSPWENPTRILWPQFLLDVVLVFDVISLVLNACTVILLRGYTRWRPTSADTGLAAQ